MHIEFLFVEKRFFVYILSSCSDLEELVWRPNVSHLPLSSDSCSSSEYFGKVLVVEPFSVSDTLSSLRVVSDVFLQILVAIHLHWTPKNVFD